MTVDKPRPSETRSDPTRFCGTHDAKKGTVKHTENGEIVAECARCGQPIRATKIDHDYFKHSNELVVLNWEVIK